MSSKRNQRRKQCGSKRKYFSLGEARAALVRTKNKNRAIGLRTLLPGGDRYFVAYHCGVCGRFHIGHTSPDRI